MGGDHGPAVTVPAAVAYLQAHPEARALLVGDASAIEHELQRAGTLSRAQLVVRHAAETVAMDESPAQALRNKKDSSMRVAIDLVKAGEAQAAVSAGNTGALMAISRFVLKMLPGIDRPAIVSELPTMLGGTYVLDLGANVDCEAEHLLQFALMGATLVSAVERKDRPSVGILNIGEEAIKGNEVVKQASDLLRRSGLNFIGNVEGDDIYKGKSDVVVCDGFVGNVVLKASEGVVQMLGQGLRDEFTRNPMRKLLALLAWPAVTGFRKRFDHRRYNGATLLGLRGVVVKSHGSADIFSFGCALDRAAREAGSGVLEQISARLASYAQAAGTARTVSPPSTGAATEPLSKLL